MDTEGAISGQKRGETGLEVTDQRLGSWLLDSNPWKSQRKKAKDKRGESAMSLEMKRFCRWEARRCGIPSIRGVVGLGNQL